MLDDVIANSYKNFHAKGLHYVCLERSPVVTLKAYFFEGDAVDLPEVVVPHNHRYNFTTEVLAGELTDIEYTIVPVDMCETEEVAQQWNYLTPLNGGNGFTWVGETGLVREEDISLEAGGLLLSLHDKIHTIRVKPGTVLLLSQMQDKVPVGRPTQAYSFGTKEQKPNTSGLYEKFTLCEMIGRLQQLTNLGVDIGEIIRS